MRTFKWAVGITAGVMILGGSGLLGSIWWELARVARQQRINRG